MAHSEDRRERYQYFRSLGFSSAEARTLRDQSTPRTTAHIDTTIRRIESDPLAPPERREFARRLRENARPYTPPPQPPQRRRPTFQQERTTRLERFRRWSNKFTGFPESVRSEIADINISAGLDVNSGYGFRVFYHRYVNGETPAMAQLRAERRDT